MRYLPAVGICQNLSKFVALFRARRRAFVSPAEHKIRVSKLKFRTPSSKAQTQKMHSRAIRSFDIRLHRFHEACIGYFFSIKKLGQSWGVT